MQKPEHSWSVHQDRGCYRSHAWHEVEVAHVAFIMGRTSDENEMALLEHRMASLAGSLPPQEEDRTIRLIIKTAMENKDLKAFIPSAVSWLHLTKAITLIRSNYCFTLESFQEFFFKRAPYRNFLFP